MICTNLHVLLQKDNFFPILVYHISLQTSSCIVIVKATLRAIYYKFLWQENSDLSPQHTVHITNFIWRFIAWILLHRSNKYMPLQIFHKYIDFSKFDIGNWTRCKCLAKLWNHSQNSCIKMSNIFHNAQTMLARISAHIDSPRIKCTWNSSTSEFLFLCVFVVRAIILD